jgi:hypothetical protein
MSAASRPISVPRAAVWCAMHPSILLPAAARRRTRKATSGTATAALRQLPNSVWSGLDITIFGRRRPASRHALPPLPILLLRLTTTHTQNQLKGVMHRAINSYRLLIIDEIGYLSMNREQANLFFQVIAARYEKGLRSRHSTFELSGARLLARPARMQS